jgi:hypothetical protein
MGVTMDILGMSPRIKAVAKHQERHGEADQEKIRRLAEEWALYSKSPALPAEMRSWLMRIFASRTHGAAVGVDSGYDVATEGVRTDTPLDPADFVTLGDLVESPTGETEPTHRSGSGLRARIFEDEFVERLYEIEGRWLGGRGLGDVELDALTDAICDLNADPSVVACDPEITAIELAPLLAGEAAR